MVAIEPSVGAGMTDRRVSSDTRRGFYALLIVSLVLHLVLTPLAGLIGFLEAWLTRPDAVDEGPQEQLREIPIELFDDEETPKSEPGALPEEDPVAMIDQLVDLPVEPAAVPPVAPPAAAPATKAKPVKGDDAKRGAEADAGTPPPATGAPQPSASPASSVTTAPSGSSAPPSASTQPPPSPDATAPPGPPIDNPIALAGKGGKLIEKQTSVGLVLYMDRVRSHPLGKRIASLLPKLPQWNEFFGDSRVNPVDDFDRMFLLGPSFADSSGLVMAIEYNTSQDKIRNAVNGLVKQRGSWMTGAKIPTAVTFADRAERVILFPAPKVVVIVPPHLREQAQKQGVVGVPKAKGPEAVVAYTVNPAKAMRRFGVDLPGSLQSAKVRVTPLPGGQVLLELEAQDETAAKATETAALLTRQVNGLLDLLGGVSNLLGRFGFGGLEASMDLPRISLEADGKVVKGRQVLSQAQVGFILDRVERELNRYARRRLPAATPSSAPKAAPPPRPPTQSPQ
jgi:hypothetical protein